MEKIIHHDQISFFPEIQQWLNIHKSINAINHINVLKDKTKKNHMIISIEAEESFNKIPNAFMIKV